MLIFAYIIMVISFCCWIRSVYLCLKKNHPIYPMWISYAFILIANVQVADYQTKTKHVIFAIGNMKAIKEIKENSKLEILQTSIDGISGILHMTGLRKCTFIASWGGGWEHVSVCPSNRLPDWDEMCAIKDMFWNDDEVVMQLHPAKNNYVNLMENCLHLWRPIGKEIPVPPTLYV